MIKVVGQKNNSASFFSYFQQKSPQCDYFGLYVVDSNKIEMQKEYQELDITITEVNKAKGEGYID